MCLLKDHCARRSLVMYSEAYRYLCISHYTAGGIAHHSLIVDTLGGCLGSRPKRAKQDDKKQ